MFEATTVTKEPKRAVVAIAGGSGSGKTTLVRAAAKRFGAVCVVDLDSYYLDRSGLAPNERCRLNFDEPAAIDLPLLLDHLRQLAAGESVRKPRYSFQSHTRIGSEPVSPAPLILVEGLFTLWWKELRPLFQLKIFVDTPADLRLARRLRRDVVERGRTVEAVLAQYESTVRPMHERYIEPTRNHADLVVANDGRIEDCAGRIHAAINFGLTADVQRT